MRHSLTDGAGYLVIDHANSPGLTAADVAHLPGGMPVVGAGQVLESDIAQCQHCQQGIRLNPLRIRSRGYCPKCDHYVCDRCEAIRVKTGVCVPMPLVLDAAQNHFSHYMGREDAPEAATPAVLLTDVFQE